MKHVAAGAHLPTPRLLSLHNTQTIEPTTAWASFLPWCKKTRYSFLQLSRLGRARDWGRTVVTSRTNENSQRTWATQQCRLLSLPVGKFSRRELLSRLGENSVDASVFWTWDPRAQSHTVCRYATLARHRYYWDHIYFSAVLITFDPVRIPAGSCVEEVV